MRAHDSTGEHTSFARHVSQEWGIVLSDHQPPSPIVSAVAKHSHSNSSYILHHLISTRQCVLIRERSVSDYAPSTIAVSRCYDRPEVTQYNYTS